LADFRYTVGHDVDDNELHEIDNLLNQLQGNDSCTIIVDSVDQRNAERVMRRIDDDAYNYYTKGIGQDSTQIIVKRTM
jgi:hypothetical protein